MVWQLVKLFNSSFEPLNNPIEIAQYVYTGAAKYCHPVPFQPTLATSISSLSPKMGFSIYFDSQPQLRTIKINDVPADTMLSTEL